MTTIIHTEAELHKLLDSLVDGQIVTARWVNDEYHTTIIGPVVVNGAYVYCRMTMRLSNGDLSAGLASVEATFDQTTTVTRDDPDALRALIESLTEGQMVTAEWRDGDHATVVTGDVCHSGISIYVLDLLDRVNILTRCSEPSAALYSVTVTHPTTVRWEREA